MKFAIILSIFMALSHQQYFGHPPLMFGFTWLVIPFPNPSAFDTVLSDTNPNGQTEKEEEEFPDVHFRSKVVNHFQPSGSLENKQTGRFFFNLANSGNKLFNIYNPILKTATITFTLTVTTISSVVTCVPSFQFVGPSVGLGVNPVVPVCVGRKRRQFSNDEFDEVHQFPIDPSQTLKLKPTAVPSLDVINSRGNHLPNILVDQETNFRSLISPTVDPVSIEERHLIGKRFVTVNRNKFVVSATITTYEFVPTILTKTINLVNPPSAKQCGITTCADCIPPGYIICPAPT